MITLNGSENMLLIHSFFTKPREILFGSLKTSKAPKKRTPWSPFYVRWSPFSGAIYDETDCGYDSGCGSSCCGSYDYTYNGARFSAPNFNVSIWDAVYDYGTHIERDAGVSISDPGGYGGRALVCIDNDCFTAGTQVVVGAEFTDDDVFVQYITVNIEDIQVGDFVYSYDTRPVRQRQFGEIGKIGIVRFAEFMV